MRSAAGDAAPPRCLSEPRSVETSDGLRNVWSERRCGQSEGAVRYDGEFTGLIGFDVETVGQVCDRSCSDS